MSSVCSSIRTAAERRHAAAPQASFSGKATLLYKISPHLSSKMLTPGKSPVRNRQTGESWPGRCPVKEKFTYPAGRPHRASSKQAPDPSLPPAGKSSLPSLFLLSPRNLTISRGPRPLPGKREIYLSSRQATPGSSLPSMNSREAPPPVEIWVILSA